MIRVGKYYVNHPYVFRVDRLDDQHVYFVRFTRDLDHGRPMKTPVETWQAVLGDKMPRDKPPLILPHGFAQ